MIEIPFQDIKVLCDKYAVRRLMLFGSALRDDFNQNSDIDLLVEYQPTANVTLLDMAALQRELSIVFQRRVDLGTPRSLRYMRDEVLNSAQVIYEQAG
ncbi:MAG: hypothetical protein EA396_12610 [Anaerolineaceae bacterium]|nr:MAG: hypothetical protein EA396_12610 [Anaerolineaceae bacterium]